MVAIKWLKYIKELKKMLESISKQRHVFLSLIFVSCLFSRFLSILIEKSYKRLRVCTHALFVHTNCTKYYSLQAPNSNKDSNATWWCFHFLCSLWDNLENSATICAIYIHSTSSWYLLLTYIFSQFSFLKLDLQFWDSLF